MSKKPATFRHKLEKFWNKTQEFTKQWKKELIVFSGIGILIIGGFLGAFYSFYGAIPRNPPIILEYGPKINPILASQESFNFTITAFDPLDKPITYMWFLDGLEQGVLSNTYNYLSGSTDSGMHSISVEISNGKDMTSHEWNLTILDLHLLTDYCVETEDSFISQVYDWNGILYFCARDNEHGYELFRSDGTGEGTYLVKDINPGISSSNPEYFAEMGGKLYFSATSATYGEELWCTNGTEDGTYIVKNIRAVQFSSSPTELIVMDNILYFIAHDGTHGEELFRSDGTNGGTYMVKDLFSGPGGSEIENLVLFKDSLYFAARNDTSYGVELWKSNGNDPTTVFVKDCSYGSGSSYPENFFVSGDKLYFSANDLLATGRELWVTEGDTSSTQRVIDLYSGSMGSFPKYLTEVNGEVFFVANNGTSGNELFKVNSTFVGIVEDIYLGSSSSTPSYLISYDNMLYFTAIDGSATSRELYRSDGITTERVSDINPEGSSDPIRLTIVNGELFFRAYTPTTGHELYKYTSSGGVELVFDGIIGPDSSSPGDLIDIDGILFFSSVDLTHGNELWIYNNSIPSFVKDLYTYTEDFLDDTEPNSAVLGDYVYFAGFQKTTGTEIYRTNGVIIELVYDIWPGYQSSDPNYFVSTGDKLFFTADTELGGEELYCLTEGSVPYLVKDINNDTGSSSSPEEITPIDGKVYFSAYNDTIGREPWVSDGTEEGTYLLKNIAAVDWDSEPRDFIKAGNFIYFAADDNIVARELYKTDGTELGTTLVADLAPGGAYGSPEYLIEINEKLCFSAYNDTYGTEFHVLNPLDDSIEVFDIYNGSSGSSPEELTVCGDSVFFTADNDLNGRELWVYNSLMNTVQMVLDIYEGPNNSEVEDLVAMNGIVYFSGTNDLNGTQLWRSDGTEDGTYILKYINLGYDAYPAYLTIMYDHLFFIAEHPIYGDQYFISNGQDGHAEVIGNVFPKDSYTIGLPWIGINNRILFTGNILAYGTEIYTGY